jgi:diguanylate cyclase (GGDEF)-like protein/PAS domain S-box-containing protein
MLRLQHSSGHRIVFPQVIVDLLSLALATLATISFALILSAPAQSFCPTLAGDKSKLGNAVVDSDVSLACLKNDLPRLERNPLTATTGGSEAGQLPAASAGMEGASKRARLRRPAVVACIGISFFLLLFAGRRFLRIALLRPYDLLEKKAQRLQDLIVLGEQRATELFAAVPCGLMVLRSDLTVLSINRACREMFRVPAEEMRHAQLESVFPALELRNKALETLSTGLPERNLELTVPGGIPAGEFRVSLARTSGSGGEHCLLVAFEDVTQVAWLRRSELESRGRYEDLFQHATDCVIIFDETEQIVDVNPALERSLGFSRNEMLGESLSSIIASGASSLKATSGPHMVEARRKVGGPFPAQWISHPVQSSPQKLFVAHLRDFSMHNRVKLLEQDCLRVLEMVTNNKPLPTILSQLASLMERQDPTLACAVSVMRNGRLYYDAAPTLPSAFVKELDGLVMGPKSGTCGDAAYARKTVIVRDIATDQRWDGRRHLAWAYDLHASWSSPIFSGLGAVLGSVAMFRREPGEPDASQVDVLELASRLAAVAIEQWNLTDMLSHQAHYDALTKLPNRSLFEEQLEAAVSKARQRNTWMAVLYIDLDRFKLINDTLGHALGDTLLSQAGRRLRNAAGPNALLARMGGDEFAVILEEPRDARAPAAVASRLLEALKRPFDLDGSEVFVSASIGISTFPKDGHDVAALLRSADSAMYRAKDQGKNTFEVFAPEMSVRNRERLEIETNLHRALERDELSLYYQPQYEVESGRLVALETLLRWKHPKLGVVLPGKFIPAAEENGLILPIGDWVLRQATLQNSAWQRCGSSTVQVAVNVSARQFEQPNFVESLAGVLAASKLDPQLLELELTETLVLRDIDKFAPRLNDIRNLGVKIAIDDFGVGYSSLNYLQRLPFDTLKIDKSFMDEIRSGSSDCSLIESIVDMTHNLGMQVTAEGVETEAQLEMLSRAGCDRLQGYLLSKPLPTESAEGLLRGRTGLKRLKLATESGQNVLAGFIWEDSQSKW